MRPTDGERDILREQEQDVADLDDGGFDRDEWCPPDDLFEQPAPVLHEPFPEPDPEFPW